MVFLIFFPLFGVCLYIFLSANRVNTASLGPTPRLTPRHVVYRPELHTPVASDYLERFSFITTSFHS